MGIYMFNKKQSQKDFVKQQLAIFGEITRNEALQAYISRLGAIIHALKNEGYVFDAKYIKRGNGTDYKYKAIKFP